MSRYGAGIRRGSMAADRHFTQIANALFRDRRISFKAKGIFGLISTHRDGWRVTVAELARSSTDGRDAVNTGLEELERYGYLSRDRVRRDDGTFGEAIYSITDIPAFLDDLHGGGDEDAQPPAPPRQRTGRSGPMTGIPALDGPAQADHPAKNTSTKKTKKQNTRPVPPSVPDARARAKQPSPDETDTNASSAPRDAPEENTPGIGLLRAVAAAQPEFLLCGPTLREQGTVVTDMLAHGWRPSQVRRVITGRPLPDRIRTSVDAIVAARLRAAGLAPPQQPELLDDEFFDAAHAVPAADRTPPEALNRRVMAECAGCGSPDPVTGEDLCPRCLDWPLCRTCTGPTPRRAHPGSDGRCSSCARAGADADVSGRISRA